METEEEDDEIPSEFISRKDLEKNRLSREGITENRLSSNSFLICCNKELKCFFS